MRTKPLNNGTNSMETIMENWRGFSLSSVDLVQLDEEYKHFCNLYDRFIILNESNQEDFLLEEGAFWDPIVKVFKKLGEELGASRKEIGKILTDNDGLLWKVLKLLGWSLDTLGKLIKQGYDLLKAVQQGLFDWAQNNPITGLKGEELTQWLKTYFDSPQAKFFARASAAGILLALVVGAIYAGVHDFPFVRAGTLILAALAGNFTAMELIEEGWFADLLFSVIAGVALSAAFPGLGIAKSGIFVILKVLVSAYRAGKTAAPAITPAIKKIQAWWKEDEEEPAAEVEA